MKENYDNLGLFASLSRCEPDLLDMINFNFFALDSTWQLRIVAIVDDLPMEAEEGSVYIVDQGIYSPEFSFAIFDGVGWIYIPLREGNLFYSEEDSDFLFFNGSEFVAFGEIFGDVNGPDSSVDNSIARFDGTTGKIIQGSNLTVSDEGDISGARIINATSLAGNDVYAINNVQAPVFNLGGPTVEGAWRIRLDAGDLVFERRESGFWVWKQRITP